LTVSCSATANAHCTLKTIEKKGCVLFFAAVVLSSLHCPNENHSSAEKVSFHEFHIHILLLSSFARLISLPSAAAAVDVLDVSIVVDGKG
jgi:hypothetical protein